MAATKTLTVDQLIADHADRIAKTVGIDLTDDYRTPDGFPQLLTAVADRLSPLDHTRDWLQDAAADLDAVNRLGGNGKKTQRLLKRVDNTLYEAREELELI